MDKRVTVDYQSNGIALVKLCRTEKHNALDMAMFEALKRTIKELKYKTSVKAVIVTSDGEDFCTGLDVKAIMKNKKSAIKLLFKWLPGQANLAQYVSTGWREVPAPVIFAISGRCWGGGLQIALGGDFRFAHPDSSWSIMEARWGLVPDMGGSVRFRELMRQDQLLELSMTAKEICGSEAHSLNMVTHLSESPLEEATKFAEKLIKTSPDVLAATKKLYQNTWWSSIRKALWLESYYQIKILRGRNQRIAVKRAQTHEENKPEYKHRSFR